MLTFPLAHTGCSIIPEITARYLVGKSTRRLLQTITGDLKHNRCGKTVVKGMTPNHYMKNDGKMVVSPDIHLELVV